MSSDILEQSTFGRRRDERDHFMKFSSSEGSQVDVWDIVEDYLYIGDTCCGLYIESRRIDK